MEAEQAAAELEKIRLKLEATAADAKRKAEAELKTQRAEEFERKKNAFDEAEKLRIAANEKAAAEKEI